jgi:hypothetical protein
MGKQNLVKSEPSPTHSTVRELTKWLKEQLYLDRSIDSRFSRVTVRQIVKGNKRGEEVFSVDVPKKAKDEWAGTAAIDLYMRLQSEAAVLQGLQKWAIYSYFSDDNENHISRFLVSIQGTEEEKDDLELESADRGGLTHQAMRHAEAFAKLTITSQMGAYQALQSQVARQATLIEKLLDQRMSTIDMVEELVQHKQDHEIRAMKETAKAETLREAGKRITGLIMPAIANRIAGKESVNVKRDSIMLMMKGLMTSVMASEERAQSIMANLGPEEQIAFMNVYEELSKATEGEPPKKPQPEEHNTNGESKNPLVTVEYD